MADLHSAHAENINLNNAHLDGAAFLGIHLEGADLRESHLEKADMRNAHLEGANLCGTFFDSATQLEGVSLESKQHGTVYITGTRWNDVDLSVINWSQKIILGDEQKAQLNQIREQQRTQYERAVRANRQLAVVLQSQGLNERAAQFAYRAQKLQRIVLWLQKKFGQYFFSLLLDLLAGYGYRPGRSVIWYLIIIFGFALTYHVFGGLSLFPPDALIFSIMSFHGRGFFPSLSSETNLHNPLVMLAAAEAIVGLLIEISFIATFTQRFFGK